MAEQPTAIPAPTLSPSAAALVIGGGLECMQDVDANGYDYLTLGVLAHVVLSTSRGRTVTLEEIGEEDPDGSVVAAVNELLDSGYLEVVDGELVAGRFADDSDDDTATRESVTLSTEISASAEVGS